MASYKKLSTYHYPHDSKMLSFPPICANAKKLYYGLKQAPPAWFDRFSTFLFTLGFQSSKADPSLFVLKQQSDIVILLLYVDDMLITGNFSDLLDNSLYQLKHEFVMKD